MNSLRDRVPLMVGVAWLLFCSALPAEEPVQSPPAPSAGRPLLEYKSNHLHVRTDLAQREADALCDRLEKTLRFAARYWGREPRGRIECYVVDDLDNWPDEALPHRLARIIIFGVGGATIPKTAVTRNRRRNQPAVFASSRPGVAEHEVIHAYCAQTFGSGGPEWYKEGMAEMASRGSTRSSGIQCSREQFASLRLGKRTSVPEILAVGNTRTRLSAALTLMMEDPAHVGRHVSLAAWTQTDTDNVALARDEYLRSWVFCYMLLHNPNYAKRFRAAGNLMVTRHHEAFEHLFDPVRGEIAFEYKFLLEHLAAGYRVDLCRWDWQTRFRLLEVSGSHKTRVAAARGFQASGLEVSAGHRYGYRTDGQWSTGTGDDSTDADGRADDSGRLVGVVMSDFNLGDPFLLGTDSSFEAPMDGRLYLRCNDAWNELGDNEGKIVVEFSSR